MTGQISLKDSGECFVIDPTARKVIIPYAHEAIGTVGDHNSEQVTFKCPREIDGHDVSQCASRYITWINTRGEVGHDELTVAQVGEDAVYLTWTIKNGLTVAKGLIRFSVHFEDKDADGSTQYRWSTTTCKDCKILSSVNSVMGAYEAVYVSGDTLVFSDYTPVRDKTLSLETIGIVPQGTLTIKDGGKHDVGEYAEVEVVEIFDTPTISVGDDGVVTAEANGKTYSVELKNCCDTLIPENIKHGVNVLGVTGVQKVATVDIVNNAGSEILFCMYTEYGENGDLENKAVYIEPQDMAVIQVPLRAKLCLYYDGYTGMDDTTYMVDRDDSFGANCTLIPPNPADGGGSRTFLVSAYEGEAKIVISPYIDGIG